MGTVAGRFQPHAAETLRLAIREAGGVEVYAVGDVVDAEVVTIVVHARGTPDAVPAPHRAKPGQIVVHNHPSGNLRPSPPDLQLAARFGDDGVGFIIVDNDVTRANWVVEPAGRRIVGVDPSAIRQFFEEGLPSALPGWESRPQQLEMALAVAESLSDARPLVVEAGTGTGKSLAYLVPAALWANANDGKVIVATHTLSLQSQLVRSDLPLLPKGGIDVTWAVLVGRNNYPCRRRLDIAKDLGGEDAPTVEALVRWSNSGRAVQRADLPFPVEPDLWDRVLSDGDLTLSVRCPTYGSCHYYTARRDAAAARIVVANQALLLADLAIRADADSGVLPAFDRLIIDEAHHLEDSATGTLACRVTARAIQRALGPTVDTPKRPGALTLMGVSVPALKARTDAAQEAAWLVWEAADAALATEAPPSPERREIRTQRMDWNEVKGQLGVLVDQLDVVVRALTSITDDAPPPEASQAQPLLDLKRASRRLSEQAAVVGSYRAGPADGRCRWTEAATRTPTDGVAVCDAPIDVSETLRRVLWTPFPGSVATSATLTVAGRFQSWIDRVGPDGDPNTRLIDSPFDHATQAMLGLPRDLPVPDAADWPTASATAIVEAVSASRGGAFVLCTSYAAVRAYSAALRSSLPGTVVLAQGEGGRPQLLERFKHNGSAVLVGTDSFWEGVSLPGDGLRLVVIPRLPFRVPDDPLHLARAERVTALGLDPFRVLTLPDAVLKLRQGYGRLIRTCTDRGAVVLLDRRLHDRSYGRVLLASLPPARRVTGPWRAVREQLVALYRTAGVS